MPVVVTLRDFNREPASGNPTNASSTNRDRKRLARPGMVLDSCRNVFAPQSLATRIGGALVKEETFVPSYAGSLVYFSVIDIAETLEKVVANKGKMLVPKTAIGEYGFCAYFEDSEGNRIGLHTM